MEHHAHGRGQGHPWGWGNDVLPLHLQHPMPTFTMWLKARVKDLVAASATIDEELLQLSCPPSWIAYTYFGTWAYGNHFWVDLETTRPTNLTYNARVACIFNQASQSSMRNQNRIVANLNYVGVLKEILLWIILGFVWFCSSVHGSHPTFMAMQWPYVKTSMGFGKWTFDINSHQQWSHMCS